LVFKTAPLAALLVLVLAGASSAQVPRFGHVFIVVEENHSYSSVIGNPAMTYLNSLANQYAVATNFYADTHPSIGNYFMLTTGELIDNNDDYPTNVDIDNIVRELVSAGKTWKSYAESLPSAGYTGGNVYPYIKHHNPFAYFTDVVNGSTEKNNLVPFTQFAKDLANGQLPEYSYIIPNEQNDAHDCPAGMTTCTDTDKLENADDWLQANIGPLVNSATFQADGLLIITFDEAAETSSINSGGRIPVVIVSPKLKSAAYKGRGFYHHASVLRLMATGLGLTNFPGASAYVSDMAEFFGNPTWPCPVPDNGAPSAFICSVANGSTLTSPFEVFAGSLMNNSVISSQLLVDGSLVFQTSGSRVDTVISTSTGTHVLTVKSTDSTNHTVSTTIKVTIAAN
jgi:phosphatidylinositol-3-phosphatase